MRIDGEMSKKTLIKKGREFAKELKGAYDWYGIWQRMTISA